jgi:hypothetical protein
MAILKPEDLDKVKRRQIHNILAKQAAGKTITAREERALAEAASDVPAGQENFVRTHDELAQRLSTSRKTIQNVIRRRDDHPRPRADGRHDVTAWLKFFADNHIAGADAEGSPEDRIVTVADWKSRELELKCEKLAIENAKCAGELVEAVQVETGLASLMAAVRQGLNNFAPRLAAKMLNLKDYHEAEELIQSEVDVLLRIVHQCDFLDGIGPAISAYQPPPEVAVEREARAKKARAQAKPGALVKGKPRGRGAKKKASPKSR